MLCQFEKGDSVILKASVGRTYAWYHPHEMRVTSVSTVYCGYPAYIYVHTVRVHVAATGKYQQYTDCHLEISPNYKRTEKIKKIKNSP
jgi:hypothetical protein